MRKLPPRVVLSVTLQKRLQKETLLIGIGSNAKEAAALRYKNARETKWFAPIISALRGMAGYGERCMLCSGSEASQVEHFYPKKPFPERAMTWENFLWACGLCNQSKGDRFPLDSQSMPLLINPLDEHVWSFFFIDEYGNLTPRWNVDLDDFDPRAATTREIIGLDRQALQESRYARLRDLRKRVEDSLRLFKTGELGQNDLRERLAEWLQQPFQPDVADYFLNGPGKTESPFSEYFALLD